MEFKIDFEVQVRDRGDNTTQIGVLFQWPSMVIDRSQMFHDLILIPACKLIRNKMEEKGLGDAYFLNDHVKPLGLEMEPWVGALWNLPCARLVKAYDGVRDVMMGRIDVMLLRK